MYPPTALIWHVALTKNLRWQLGRSHGCEAHYAISTVMTQRASRTCVMDIGHHILFEVSLRMRGDSVAR